MKRVIFFVMAACSALLNAGCEPYVVSEQELISLQYKTTDGKVLELDPENFNPAIAANKYGDLGEILFCGNLTTIHASAFENQHRLTMVDMPLGLSDIGERAFYNCNNLETVHIPWTVIRIGNYAFYNCNNLKEVYFYGRPPVLGSMTFSDRASESMVIYVPKEYYGYYQTGWSDKYSKSIIPF